MLCCLYLVKLHDLTRYLEKLHQNSKKALLTLDEAYSLELDLSSLAAASPLYTIVAPLGGPLFSRLATPPLFWSLTPKVSRVNAYFLSSAQSSLLPWLVTIQKKSQARPAYMQWRHIKPHEKIFSVNRPLKVLSGVRAALPHSFMLV